MGEDEKLPAWSVTLQSGAKVTLVRDEANARNILCFASENGETNVVLTDPALAAVVALAVTKAGIPVLAG